MYETIILGIACLSAPLFAKFAGYEIAKKPYDMVGVAGLFFLLGAAFALGPSKVDFLLNISAIGTIVSHILGWLMLIIGAFRSALDVIMEREQRMDDPSPVLTVHGEELKPPVSRADSQTVKPMSWHAVKSHHR